MLCRAVSSVRAGHAGNSVGRCSGKVTPLSAASGPVLSLRVCGGSPVSRTHGRPRGLTPAKILATVLGRFRNCTASLSARSCRLSGMCMAAAGLPGSGGVGAGALCWLPEAPGSPWGSAARRQDGWGRSGPEARGRGLPGVPGGGCWGERAAGGSQGWGWRVRGLPRTP